MKVPQLKKNEFKRINTRYILYNFFHKVTYKRIVFTPFYLIICIQTVKDARCKTKIWDALMSQTGSV